MEVGDGSGDARAFRVNFSTEGMEKLREVVLEKLKEFMGDYTDDTLAEYVIVLLKNGRRKDEARNELNVFLDDDSHSFVSWLWDHLGSNLNLYVQAQESQEDEAAKPIPMTGKESGRNNSHQVEAESEKLNISLRSRHNREWKGLVKDEAEHPLHGNAFYSTHAEQKSHGKVGDEGLSVLPQPAVQRKRRRPEERQEDKVEAESEKLNKSLRSHHNREWKGLVTDEAEHSLHGKAFDSTHAEQESHGKVGDEGRSVLPQPAVQRKRRWLEEQPENKESQEDEAAKSRPMTGKEFGRNDSHQVEAESKKLNKSLRSRHNREWKGLLKDEAEHPLHGNAFYSTHAEQKSHGKVGDEGLSVLPQPAVQRKRRRPEERQEDKREVVSQGTINAPRRLLQFAVRDAVAISRPTNLTAEPSLQRLRSVVSTSTEDSNTEERPLKIQSAARLPNAMATAIKAVAEAAKDVTKVRSSCNVFDRLGRASDVSNTLYQFPEVGDDVAYDGEAETYENIRDQARSTYDQRNDYSRPQIGNVSLSESRMADPELHDEDYYDARVFGQEVVDASQTGISGGHQADNSLMVHRRLGKSAGELAHKPGKNHGQPGAASNISHKLINTSGNINTWKSSQYKEARESSGVDIRKLMHVTEVTPMSGLQLMKDNNDHVAFANGNAKLEVGLQKKSQNTEPSVPGPNPISRPVEDADSRTIFVSNVHFAATKDSLSRHFNKYGEVLKVTILMDAATRQPRGSAYVEFRRKESADNALSLDGMSFMSRILKVVRKSCALPEASSTVNWPRVARASPFAISRFGRFPFPRGIPGTCRGRFPIKTRARSMQWKRDAQSTATEVRGLGPANRFPPSTRRSFTYVRTEPKTNGSSDAS